jgi:NTE family protein
MAMDKARFAFLQRWLGRSSPAAEPGHIAPELRQRLETFPITAGIGEEATAALLARAGWFLLPGGETLLREGDDDRAVFIVVTGCLGVFTPDDHGKDRLLARIPAGETVGEMAVISGSAHSARLVALRDSELLRISKPDFEELLARHPRLSMNLMRLLVSRLQNTSRSSAIGPQMARTVAIVPLQPGIDTRALGQSLVTAFRGLGLEAEPIGSEAASNESNWFSRCEVENDVVLYMADPTETPWTQLCLRQADRIFLVARCGEPVTTGFSDPEALGRLRRQHAELLLLQAAGKPGRSSLALPPDTPVGQHYYLREGNRADLARIARILTGRAVSLVLAGGGARGFAHIGVIRALKDAGVPFDFVGGSSMGAIVAAGLAMGWDTAELQARIRRSFVEQNPLSDFTLPLVAVLRGRKVSNLLRDNFGDTMIEDMAMPCFCVSSNLTLGRAHIHRDGPLWKALRATVSIPGLLPPVVQDSHLLVDGGLMNNMPVDIMTSMAEGPVIGVDVAGDEPLVADSEDFHEGPWLQVLRRQLKGAPSIVSILMRTGTVGNEVQRRQARAQSTVLFDPPLPGIGLRSWQAFDEAIEQGYRHALDVIEQDGLDFMWTIRGHGSA